MNFKLLLGIALFITITMCSQQQHEAFGTPDLVVIDSQPPEPTPPLPPDAGVELEKLILLARLRQDTINGETYKIHQQYEQLNAHLNQLRNRNP